MLQTPDLETPTTTQLDPLAPANWNLAFPGDTPLLTRLGDRLTLADFHLRHTPTPSTNSSSNCSSPASPSSGCG